MKLEYRQGNLHILEGGDLTTQNKAEGNFLNGKT